MKMEHKVQQKSHLVNKGITSKHKGNNLIIDH